MLIIKEVREKKGFSQDKVVELTGIPKRSYVNYESGKTDIPLTKLQNIASALNVRIEELILDSNSTQTESKDIQPTPYQGQNDISNLELRKDLHAISQGMIKNFETISEGVFETLKGQQKILGFIEELRAADIANATKNLSDFLAKN